LLGLLVPFKLTVFDYLQFAYFYYRVRTSSVYLPNFHSEISNIFPNLTNKEPVPRERENPNGSIPTYHTLTCRVTCFGLFQLDPTQKS